MKIMGIDAALTRTGVAFPDGTTRLIRTKDGTGDARLLYIRDHLRVALRSSYPDLVILEDIRAGLKGAAARQIPMVHGAVRVELMDQAVPYIEINASTLKAYATGNGNANKAAMIMAAYKRSGREFTDDNECDAAWLRWLGLDWAGQPELILPAAQRARLRVVDWGPATYAGLSPAEAPAAV